MSSTNIVLKAENISKQYRLGTVGTGTLSHDLNRWWHAVRGKEDPYLKVGDTNDRSSKGTSEYVWALKDINFEVQAGEVLGIIGKNGAGKSTLLKILSKVTTPTSGTIKYKGRIASLLEVGTGFNPELTGRENVYLNGAILGMTKKEITSKLTEIIEFSGCERYIDTPTKRYSSGMTVRLAFAVAAFLEPEILVVDEVLAVGDAEFQKKAIGKMQDISRQGGRTVLFVSHNMAAVKSLCTRGIVLENGKVVFAGEITEVINRYLKTPSISNNLSNVLVRSGTRQIIFTEIKVYGDEKNSHPYSGSDLNVEIKFENKYKVVLDRIVFDMGIEDDFGHRICWISSSLVSKNLNISPDKISVIFPKNPFNCGHYYITLFISIDGKCADWIDNAYIFEVDKGDYYHNGKTVPSKQSKVLFDFNMDFEDTLKDLNNEI